MKRMNAIYGILALVLLGTVLVFAARPEIGIFSDHSDIGSVNKPGAVEYNATDSTYVIAGGGENMWFATDAFHYVWKLMSGDVTLAGDIRWIGTGGNPHRKACLIIRQSLDPD